jgi:hypothetical protein
MNKGLIIAAAALIFGLGAADAVKVSLSELSQDCYATILELGE